MTFMRNFLACRLFDFLGYPAPTASYVSMFINYEYAGVFDQVEQIDEDFLARNGRKPNSLYKTLNHGANMSPLIHYSLYPITWEKKYGDVNDYSDIQLFFNKVRYWTNEDFKKNIGKEIDIDDFLTYFAVLFSIASNDNYCKNFYFYSNPDREIFELFPWDNDASFGNRWTGDYLEWYESFITGSYLDYQMVFQRLMDDENHRERFWEHVNTTVTDGFDFLHRLIDETHVTIKNDAYKDMKKNKPMRRSILLLLSCIRF